MHKGDVVFNDMFFYEIFDKFKEFISMFWEVFEENNVN